MCVFLILTSLYALCLYRFAVVVPYVGSLYTSSGYVRSSAGVPGGDLQIEDRYTEIIYFLKSWCPLMESSMDLKIVHAFVLRRS